MCGKMLSHSCSSRCMYPKRITQGYSKPILLKIHNGKKGSWGHYLGLSRWVSGKESACQYRRWRFEPWVGKTPGEGNGTPLQYSFLGNPMDRGPWWAVIHKGCKESDTTEQLSTGHYLLNRTGQPTSCPCKNYLNCHYYPFLSFQK